MYGEDRKVSNINDITMLKVIYTVLIKRHSLNFYKYITKFKKYSSNFLLDIIP